MTSSASVRTRWQMRRPRIQWLPYVLLLPTLYFVFLFTVYPTFKVLRDSRIYYHPSRPDRQMVTDLKLPGIDEATRSIRGPNNVGLAYFRAMVEPDSPEGETFRQVIGNSALYVLGTVPISMILALLFALLVNRKMRGVGIARLALFYPTVLPMVSAATIWLFFFTPDYGLWNQLFKFFGYGGPQNWVINPKLALWSLIIVAIWKNAGYFMIFYLAGLQGLPEDVYEAAALDGANWFTQLTRITVPLLRRTTLFVSVIAIIGAFQQVEHALVMTYELVSGEADLLLYEIYQQRFIQQDYGFANSLTVVMIAILFALTLANVFLTERQEYAN